MKPVHRRTVLLGALAATATPAFAQGKGEVIIATTGGLMEKSLQDDFYKRFETETGIRVRSVPIELPDQWARAMAGARSGSVPFDIRSRKRPSRPAPPDGLFTGRLTLLRAWQLDHLLRRRPDERNRSS